jgi:hypothetical protein
LSRALAGVNLVYAGAMTPRVRALGVLFGLMLLASPLVAKPLPFGKRWVLDAPDDWWYAETSNRGLMRVYTVGAATPDPVKGAPPVFAVIGPKNQGATPQVIRGISMGVGLGKGALMVPQGSEKLHRNGDLLKGGYRRVMDVLDGKLILHTYSLRADHLPGEPLESAEDRIVLVNIGGRSDEEVEAFAKVFETIKAAPKPAD